MSKGVFGAARKSFFCSFCHSKFEDYRSHRNGHKTYCNIECYWNSLPGRKNLMEHKGKWRTCLGVKCRGRKKFFSVSPLNRLCHTCSTLISFLEE